MPPHSNMGTTPHSSYINQPLKKSPIVKSQDEKSIGAFMVLTAHFHVMPSSGVSRLPGR